MSQKKIEIGNAINEGKTRRGWFVGSFIPGGGLKNTSDLEVKWGIHPQGEKRTSLAAPGDSQTISILISGEFKLFFENQTVNLKQPGDYAIWHPSLPHSSEATQDSVIITVRWPSRSS